jgi:hypothetical protein
MTGLCPHGRKRSRASPAPFRSGLRLADSTRLLRVFELSVFVAHDLSGRHSHGKEVAYETGGVVTGDTEDEIRRGL